MKTKIITTIFTLGLITTALTGCGGGGGSDSPSNDDSSILAFDNSNASLPSELKIDSTAATIVEVINSPQSQTLQNQHLMNVGNADGSSIKINSITVNTSLNKNGESKDGIEILTDKTLPAGNNLNTPLCQDGQTLAVNQKCALALKIYGEDLGAAGGVMTGYIDIAAQQNNKSVSYRSAESILTFTSDLSKLVDEKNLSITFENDQGDPTPPVYSAGGSFNIVLKNNSSQILNFPTLSFKKGSWLADQVDLEKSSLEFLGSLAPQATHTFQVVFKSTAEQARLLSASNDEQNNLDLKVNAANLDEAIEQPVTVVDQVTYAFQGISEPGQTTINLVNEGSNDQKININTADLPQGVSLNTEASSCQNGMILPGMVDNQCQVVLDIAESAKGDGYFEFSNAEAGNQEKTHRIFVSVPKVQLTLNVSKDGNSDTDNTISMVNNSPFDLDLSDFASKLSLTDDMGQTVDKSLYQFGAPSAENLKAESTVTLPLITENAMIAGIYHLNLNASNSNADADSYNVDLTVNRPVTLQVSDIASAVIGDNITIPLKNTSDFPLDLSQKTLQSLIEIKNEQGQVVNHTVFAGSFDNCGNSIPASGTCTLTLNTSNTAASAGRYSLTINPTSIYQVVQLVNEQSQSIKALNFNLSRADSQLVWQQEGLLENMDYGSDIPQNAVFTLKNNSANFNPIKISKIDLSSLTHSNGVDVSVVEDSCTGKTLAVGDICSFTVSVDAKNAHKDDTVQGDINIMATDDAGNSLLVTSAQSMRILSPVALSASVSTATVGKNATVTLQNSSNFAFSGDLAKLLFITDSTKQTMQVDLSSASVCNTIAAGKSCSFDFMIPDDWKSGSYVLYSSSDIDASKIIDTSFNVNEVGDLQWTGSTTTPSTIVRGQKQSLYYTLQYTGEKPATITSISLPQVLAGSGIILSQDDTAEDACKKDKVLTDGSTCSINLSVDATNAVDPNALKLLQGTLASAISGSLSVAVENQNSSLNQSIQFNTTLDVADMSMQQDSVGLIGPGESFAVTINNNSETSAIKPEFVIADWLKPYISITPEAVTIPESGSQSYTLKIADDSALNSLIIQNKAAIEQNSSNGGVIYIKAPESSDVLMPTINSTESGIVPDDSVVISDMGTNRAQIRFRNKSAKITYSIDSVDSSKLPAGVSLSNESTCTGDLTAGKSCDLILDIDSSKIVAGEQGGISLNYSYDGHGFTTAMAAISADKTQLSILQASSVTYNSKPGLLTVANTGQLPYQFKALTGALTLPNGLGVDESSSNCANAIVEPGGQCTIAVKTTSTNPDIYNDANYVAFINGNPQADSVQSPPFSVKVNQPSMQVSLNQVNLDNYIITVRNGNSDQDTLGNLTITTQLSGVDSQYVISDQCNTVLASAASCQIAIGIDKTKLNQLFETLPALNLSISGTDINQDYTSSKSYQINANYDVFATSNDGKLYGLEKMQSYAGYTGSLIDTIVDGSLLMRAPDDTTKQKVFGVTNTLKSSQLSTATALKSGGAIELSKPVYTKNRLGTRAK
ncbi:MAG: hypothetical protein ACO2ZM_07435 [Francisellaceae bacterium]